jgi:cytochrome d ubiquinol oxidase subunit I
MNTPTGITMVNGALTSIDPVVGMFNPSTFQQSLHMLLAAYAATGLAVAGLHAAILVRRRDAAFHRRAMGLALALGAPAAMLQPLSGDISARTVAKWQPAKLAALEGQFQTEKGAPLRIGGIPDEETRQTRFALEIPRGLSFLAFHDINAEVLGLEAFARDLWPPVIPVHFGFQIMVGLGTAMALVSAWAAFVAFRTRALPDSPLLLRALAIVTPFGFIATEAGWTVTEVGRQPWIIHGVMRTSHAVTPMPGLIVPMTIFALVYLLLGAVVVKLLAGIVRETT